MFCACFCASYLCVDLCLWFCVYVRVVVVAQSNDGVQVTLTCDTKTGKNVIWKLDGEVLDVDSEYHYQSVGPNLTVLVVDGLTVGEYSCWRGEEMLSSTYLLLEAEEKVDLGKMHIYHSYIREEIKLLTCLARFFTIGDTL